MTASARVAETFDYLTRIHQGWLTEAEEAALLTRLPARLRADTMTAHTYLTIQAAKGVPMTSREVGDDLGISKQYARSACLSLTRYGLVQVDDSSTPAVYWIGERL